MKKYNNKIPLPVVMAAMFLFAGWGSVGHKIINKNAVASFPVSMKFLASWSDSISIHASDADNRKDSDPAESAKHFIDIDNYSEFVKTGKISQNLDSLIALHGSSFVNKQGYLPWAIKAACDSLENSFKKRDWHKAMLIASDLGHYIGDSHMPLHVCANYNGQYSNQSGVHSRYESDLVGKYSNLFIYNNDTASYIPDIREFVFDMIYNNFKYADSVLKADSAAKAYAGSYNTAYYVKFWELSGNFTTRLFKNASKIIADMIYTCWVNAGSPDIATSVKSEGLNYPKRFQLEQNYPNPFNPSTTIQYSIPEDERVELKIFNSLGEQIAELVNQYQKAGPHIAVFNASNLSTGTYFYQMISRNYAVTKKLTLLK